VSAGSTLPAFASRSTSRNSSAGGCRYQYSSYQIEYSRNLLFEIGGQMEQVFQALIDRSRVPLDIKPSRPLSATQWMG
jgi:hypothetical protein